jgi:iron(III) transport system ATP-binding protein
MRMRGSGLRRDQDIAGRPLRWLGRLCSLWVLSLSLAAGCSSSDDPVIPVKSIRYWPMPAMGTSIPAPRSLAIGPNDEVICLDKGGRVLVFDQDGKLLRQWMMPESSVGKPEGVCVLKDGRMAVGDTHYNRVIMFDMQGNEVGGFGGKGTQNGQFIYPVGLARDEKDTLYVSEYGSNDRVQRFGPNGNFLGAMGGFGTGDGMFQRPSGLDWRAGKLYIADAINNRILVYTDGGNYVGVLGGPKPVSLYFPYDVRVAADGAVYVIEYGAGRLTKLGMDGKLLGRYGSTGSGEGRFSTPWGLAINSKMRCYIADTGNRRIVELQL